MATTPKVLIASKFAENAETTQYPLTPADSVRTAIDKFTAYNGTGSNVTLTVKLVALGGVAGASNITVVKIIPPGRTETFAELVGHILEAGDFISTLCGTASAAVIRSSGRQFT